MPSRLAALLLACLLVLMPADVRAGQVAHYRNSVNGGTVLIEVQGDDARLEIQGLPWHLLIRAGESFWVYDLPAGPRVLRVADFERAIREGNVAIPPVPAAPADFRLVPRGSVTIGGYRGEAYHIGIEGTTAPTPWLVVSRDPAIAALGLPLRRHIDSAALQLRLSGQGVPPATRRVRELLEGGTGLLFLGFALENIETRNIPADRFALPAEPISYEEATRNFRLSSPAR